VDFLKFGSNNLAVSNWSRFFVTLLVMSFGCVIGQSSSWAREVVLRRLGGTIVVSVTNGGYCQSNTAGPTGYGTTCPQNSVCTCVIHQGTVHGSVGHGTATTTMSVNDGASTTPAAPQQGTPNCSPMFASLSVATKEHPDLILNVNGSVCYGPDQSADIPERIVGGFSAVSEVSERNPAEKYWGTVSGYVRYVNEQSWRVGSMTLEFNGKVSVVP
jgi:hypothetical protein